MKDNAERFVFNKLRTAPSFKLHEIFELHNIAHNCTSKVSDSDIYDIKHTLFSQV